MIITDDWSCRWMWMESSLCCGSETDEWWVNGWWRLVHTHPSLMSFISFFYHSLSIHIPFHPFTFTLFVSFLITLSYQHSFSFHSSLYHFYSILLFTLFTLSLSLCWWWLRCELFHSFTHSLFILFLHSHFILPFDQGWKIHGNFPISCPARNKGSWCHAMSLTIAMVLISQNSSLFLSS